MLFVVDQYSDANFRILRRRKSDAVHDRGSRVPEGPGGRGGELYVLAARDRWVGADD